jgi:hypothetical protein
MQIPTIAIMQIIVHYFREDMKRRTLAGNCGVAVFAIAFVCIAVAFATPSWLVSDYRITGAKLDRLGLWVHCFRSLPDVNDDYQRRFFVGCRWVYDPFTTGYDEIRGFLMPGEKLYGDINFLHLIHPRHCSLYDLHTILLHPRIHRCLWIIDSRAVVLFVRWT